VSGRPVADTTTALISRRYPIPGVAYRSNEEVAAFAGAGAWSLHNLGDVIRSAALAEPNGEAVVSSRGRLTWNELDARSDRLANGLLDMGVAPGERVLVQLGIDHETVVVFAALFKSGIVPVCTVSRYRDYEMMALCERSGAVAHITSATEDLLALAQRLQARCGTLRHIITTASVGSGPLVLSDIEARGARISRQTLLASAPGPADVMSFQLSGGTTGVPKIIPRFHGEYIAYCSAFAARLGMTMDDRLLWSLPLSHNAGMILVLVPCLLSRATMVLMERFDPLNFLTALSAERATVAATIGPITHHVLQSKMVPQHDLSSMRYLFTLNRAADLEAHLGVPTATIYGITEGLLMASAPDDPEARRHHTVGSPVSPGDRVRVVRPATEESVAPGEVGELCFSGPSRLTAYIQDGAATADAFTSDGLFRTGDLVRESRIGNVQCFSFDGRIKENIDRGGEKFGTGEIETLLADHPSVLEARIVGIPDPIVGERVCAFVIPRRDRTAPDVASLASFLLERGLAKFKLPERVESIDEFPMTGVGKLDRQALRRRVSERLDAENGDEAGR
jgi:non-ribosomal peptide synthetase component E (peptide arylation enzyme)